ncbi:MAG: sirohydrochlorin cobaltochelatase [Eubacterium sp.]|nr:sirohydrochlorin cobaltochelatase [Eubacterium sp.]
MKKQAILITYTGTSCPHSKEAALTLLKREIAGQFPDFELREAFTSGRMIDTLKAVSGLEADSVEQALERAAADGIRRVVVQPLHLTRGTEYGKMACALRGQEWKFERVVLGEPLLSSEEDVAAVLEAAVQRTAAFDDGRTAICLVGHGSSMGMAAGADNIYIKIQQKLAQAGHENYYIGVLKGKPSYEDVQGKWKKGKEGARDKYQYRRVVLLPFMLAAGRHAKRDIAGEQAGAWKRCLEEEGYETVCIMEGLGQIRRVREIYAEHIRKAAVRL